MWPEIARRLPGFASAVLTGLDRDGDPVSVRCQPTLDHHAQVLRVAVPEGLGMVPGPAGLLCHYHDEQLWGLRSFLLKGTLERTGHDWMFRPRELVPGMDTTLLSNLRLLRKGRRTAKRYLAACGARRSHGTATKSSGTRRGRKLSRVDLLRRPAHHDLLSSVWASRWYAPGCCSKTA